jgi:RimJ/RimL family protein N-acetyltransferase
MELEPGAQMSYYRKLPGEKCYLSPCRLEDAARWAEWFNDLEVTLPLGDEAYTPSSIESEREAIKQFHRDRAHVFSIADTETDQLVGRCLLFNVDPVNRSAMLRIVIGEKSRWDQGYGQEAVNLLLDYGFSLLNLNSVMLGTFSFNERALRCYEKVGFKRIGSRREARIIAGEKYDIILMDMLAEEYESPYVKRLLSPGA